MSEVPSAPRLIGNSLLPAPAREWRAVIQSGLNEARGAACLALIAAVGVGSARPDHSVQWLFAAAGALAWFVLRTLGIIGAPGGR
jgi:hypothetical protein